MMRLSPDDFTQDLKEVRKTVQALPDLWALFQAPLHTSCDKEAAKWIYDRYIEFLMTMLDVRNLKRDKLVEATPTARELVAAYHSISTVFLFLIFCTHNKRF